MKSLFVTYIFVFTLVFPNFVKAAPFPNKVDFKHITTNNGLYKNNIKTIIQDKKGYIWFGGFGLYRYDGYEISKYINVPGDSTINISNYVNQLFVDSKNNLWIVCSNGIFLYERDFDKFRKIKFNQDIDDYGHTTLFEYKNKLFILHDNIYHISLTSNKYEIQQFLSLKNKNIDAALFDEKQGILYLSESPGNITFINFANGSTITQGKVGFADYLKKEKISYLETNKDYFVIAYNNGAIHLYNKPDSTMHYYEYRPKGKGINNKKIKTLYIESRDRIWIGTGGGGINVLNPKTGNFTYYKYDKYDPTSLSNNIVLDIFEDSNGIIWVGTLNGGVNFYHKNKNPFYRLSNRGKEKEYSLNHNVINDIIEDKDGNIWIGTDKGGVNVLDINTGRIKKMEHDPSKKNSVSSSNILSLAKDQEGFIWIGTWGGGLNRYNPETGKFINYRHDPNDSLSLAWDNVWALHVDEQNNLWIGFNNNDNSGLDLYDRKNDRFIHFSKQYGDSTSLKSKSIEEIFSDSKGNLWLGTTGKGLLRFNKKDSTFLHFNLLDSNENMYDHGLIIRVVFEDSKNRLWIGSEGGGLYLYNYEKNDFTCFTTNDGLPSNIVSSILEDDEGNLWLGTSNGICKFNTKSFTTVTYNPSIDLNGNQFAWGATRSKDGMMYFGTLQGMIAFYPDSIKKQHDVPPIEITGFFLAGQEAGVNVKDSPLSKQISQTKKITLSHDQNIFSFRYVALNFINSSEIQYAYMMEGLENEWNYVDEIRYATYTNLKPGNYTFKVKASNNEGVWGDNEKSIDIVILPPWWNTTWFKILTVIISVSLIVTLYRMRIAAFKKEQRALESKVQYRTSQLKSALENLKIKNEEIVIQKHSIEEKLYILEKQKDEIIKQKDEVTLISRKLHEADQIKLNLFTSISHEVRTPLTLILAPVNNLVKNTKDVMVLEKLHIIQKNAKHLLNLINQLMDFRKLEACKMEIKPVKGDIVRFIENVCDTFNYFASSHQIKYGVSSNSKEAFCWFDPDILEKILYNLLSNAFKYTSFKGEISVHSELLYDKNKNTRYIYLKVADNGKGISEDEIPNIFTRFYQVDSNNTNYPGTGIGLSFVKSLVDLYKGEVKVESKPGKGSTFTVGLPLDITPGKIRKTQNSLDANDFEFSNKEFEYLFTTTQTKPKESIKNPDQANILLVEDNFDLREYIKGELIEKFNIYEAQDGEEAMRIAKEIMPDLIISDFMMPKVNGCDFCQKIKENPLTNHIPFIMLTALKSDNKKFESFTKGADAYITKPFNAEELLIRASNLIETRNTMKEKVARELIMQPEKIQVASSDDKFLQQTVKCIEENISDSKFTVDCLARKMGMSNSQFYLKLMAIANHSPLDLIRKIRLKRAVQLMKTNEYRIAEIAYDVGFQDPKYFAKLFKKQFKYTPSEYMKNLKSISH